MKSKVEKMKELDALLCHIKDVVEVKDQEDYDCTLGLIRKGMLSELGACPKCGHINTDGGKFCSSCGVKVDEPVEEEHIAIHYLVGRENSTGFHIINTYADIDRAMNFVVKSSASGINYEILKRTYDKVDLK